MSKIGTADIKGIMLGSTEIVKAYLGTDIVYQNNAPLPYDAEIEWLGTDDNVISTSSATSTYRQYIQLNFIPTTLTKVEVKFKMYDTVTQRGIFGSNASGNKRFSCYISGSRIVSAGYRLTGSSWYRASGINTNDNTVSLDGYNLKFIYNNSSINLTGLTYDNFVYALNLMSGHSTSQQFRGRIYYCKVYDNNVLIYDLIPVRVGTTGYMYDKVSKQLFGNSGTGNFILGADKN